MGEAVLDLFIFLVTSAVDLTITEKLASDALWLFCAWTSSIVMIVCLTMLLKRGDHQFQLLVRLAFFTWMNYQPEIHLFVDVFDVFPVRPGCPSII